MGPSAEEGLDMPFEKIEFCLLALCLSPSPCCLPSPCASCQAQSPSQNPLSACVGMMNKQQVWGQQQIGCFSGPQNCDKIRCSYTQRF